MSLDDVSAYLKVQHRRRGVSIPVSDWSIPPMEQVRRGIEARSRLRRTARNLRPETVFEAVDKSPKPREQPSQPVDKWVYRPLVFYEEMETPGIGKRLLYPDIPIDTPNWKRIILEVCNKHDVSYNDILSPRRAVPIVRARHEAMWRLKMETSMSYPAIGRRLGGKDHTTILHGVRKHEERLAKDAD